MPDVLGNAARGAACKLVRVRFRRGGIPGRVQEQPPVHGRRGMVTGQMERDAHLTVGDLASSPGVLPRHTRRGVSVLQETSVVKDQHSGPDHRFHLPRQTSPDMSRIPRAGGDGMGQRLPIAVLSQPGGHRLDRPASHVSHQTTQIHLPPPAADPCARTARTPPPQTPPTHHAPQQLRPDSHLPNAQPTHKDTHRLSRPDQALLALEPPGSLKPGTGPGVSQAGESRLSPPCVATATRGGSHRTWS